jgi:hypothetical protein
MKLHHLQQTLPVALMSLIFWGCTSTPAPPPEPTKTDLIQGTWKSRASVAVYEIAETNGTLAVTGYSTFSGKEIQIRDTSWDGETLKFTSYMPMTDFVVHHENQLIDSDTMTSSITGNSSHTLIWKKVKLPTVEPEVKETIPSGK